MKRPGQLLMGAVLVCLAGRGNRAWPQPSPPPSGAASPRTHEQALKSAVDFLLDRQSPDGAWRSDVYAAYKGGDALTPLVVHALLSTPSSPTIEAACRKGKEYLAGLVEPDGTLANGVHDPSFPVYTAALSVLALSRSTEGSARSAREAWLAFLRRRQLTEDLDWQPDDKPYGGWGYCTDIPRKPRPGEFGPSFIESNLSATVFALDALRAAGCSIEDPAIQKARVFVQRCQNYQEVDKERDPRFDDGGFFFIYDDPVRNKAGVAGKDHQGRERYNSYGSATADGLRALLLCGRTTDSPRVLAARQWLQTHFSADTHPGTYSRTAELNREAMHLYYCASVARAFRELGVLELDTAHGRVAWTRQLADELTKRQLPEGSWSNPAHAFREDDPIGATAMATLALGLCLTTSGLHLEH